MNCYLLSYLYNIALKIVTQQICVATDSFLSSNILFIDIFIFFYLLF